jgi:membrane-associated protein
MDIVKKNFELVILGIIGLSVLPMVWQFVKAKFFAEKVG